MNITQIKYFLELAKIQNFCTAASSLYISQPALSRQISALENELQIRLFDRNTKHTNLTKAGRSLYEDLSIIMTELDFALKKAKVLHDGKQNLLRIGIFDAPYINDFWITFYKTLLKIDPSLEIEVVRGNFTDLYNDFVNELYDLILTLDHTLLMSKFPFCYKRLFYREYAIIYSKDSEFGKMERLDFRDFDHKNVYVVDNERNIERVLSELASVGILNPKIQRVSNSLTVSTYLEAGNGFALIDKNIVQYNDSLRAFSGGGCFSGTYVTAVWRKESLPVQKIMAAYDKT